MIRFDLNCDLGEGGPNDADLMPIITSANIACGAHAGDPQTMLRTLRLAKQYGVRVGAHPGFPDRDHFGRRELSRSDDMVFADCVAQIGALAGLACSEGLALTYIKPHGALYNMACRDAAYARPVVRAARVFTLPLMGLPHCSLETETVTEGLQYLREGFADRRYLPDGSLVPRSHADAMINDPEEAAQQVRWLLADCGVQTICVHGDHPGVVPFTRRLMEVLFPS